MTAFQNSFRILSLSLAIIMGFVLQCSAANAQTRASIIVAGGCFWCVESDFEGVTGVTEAVSGFSGGSVENPTYKQVTRGGTGHLEAVEITYNPNRVDLNGLLYMFFRSIDPTDAGGQFCDRGDSYRTAIWVGNPEERQIAETAKAAAEAELGQRIVTPILDRVAFYAADDWHQDYYKGRRRVITRYGVIRQSDAYNRYREACGRDARVSELWGDAAPFVHH